MMINAIDKDHDDEDEDEDQDIDPGNNDQNDHVDANADDSVVDNDGPLGQKMLSTSSCLEEDYMEP